MLTASALNSSEYRRRVFLVMNTSNASSMRLTGVSAPIRPVHIPSSRRPGQLPWPPERHVDGGSWSHSSSQSKEVTAVVLESIRNANVFLEGPLIPVATDSLDLHIRLAP